MLFIRQTNDETRPIDIEPFIRCGLVFMFVCSFGVRFFYYIIRVLVLYFKFSALSAFHIYTHLGSLEQVKELNRIIFAAIGITAFLQTIFFSFLHFIRFLSSSGFVSDCFATHILSRIV